MPNNGNSSIEKYTFSKEYSKKTMILKTQITHNQLLAISIGIVYLWFGALKFFPNVSPAEDLAKNTIDLLTFHLIPSDVSIILLALWETVVGALLITNIYRKSSVILALVHMVFTIFPLLFFTEQVFENLPFHLTLLGQYIIKNLVIIAGLLVVYKLPSTQPKLN